jgi:hypothetical protein
VRNIKVFSLNHSSLCDSGAGNTWYQWFSGYSFSLGLRYTSDAPVQSITLAAGNNPLAERNILADGKYIFHIGWNTGFGVSEVNDDGTITSIYTDTTINGYNPLSLALDTTNKKAYVGCYSANGLIQYDYTNIATTGVEKGPTFTTTEGLPFNKFGDLYLNGLFALGNYLYMIPIDAVNGTKVKRILLSDLSGGTVTSDEIPIENLPAGSNLRYGTFTYDPVSGYLYAFYRDWGPVVVVNPTKSVSDPTNPARAVHLNLASVGFGGTHHCYTPGIARTNAGNPNEILIFAQNGRRGVIDITPLINNTDTKPTLVTSNSHFTATHTEGMERLGDARTYFFTATTSDEREINIICARSSRYPYCGWIDMETLNAVGVPFLHNWGYYADNSNAYPWVSQYDYNNDYNHNPVIVTTQGGNVYTLIAGYGGSQHGKTRVYSGDKVPFELHTSGHITFGPFAFDDSRPIRALQVVNIIENMIVPSECSYTIEVSNDNKTTWELYDITKMYEPHRFSSSGNTAFVKISLSGQTNKAPYLRSDKMPQVLIIEHWSGIDRTKVVAKSEYHIKGA